MIGTTSILKQAKRGVKLPVWVVCLMARKPDKVADVALGNSEHRVVSVNVVEIGVW